MLGKSQDYLNLSKFIYSEWDTQKINNNQKLIPGSYRGRLSSEPENIRKTLIDIKNA